jgi:hypothetical protein
MLAIGALALAPAIAAAQSSPVPAAPAASPVPSPNPIGPAFGANDPCTSIAALVTRPSVTNSVCTVRPNHVLVETGYQNLSAEGGGNTVTYPQTLIRVGTAIPALEFDVTPPQVTRGNGAGVVAVGSTDVGAGLKYVFGYTPKFNYGGQVFFTAPTGLNGASSDGTTASYALNAGYTLNSVFSLAGTVTAQSLTNGAQRWSSVVPSLVLGVSLPNATGLNLEMALFTHAIGPGSATRTQYLIGVYRDIGPRVQLDTSFAMSPTGATGRYRYVGFGASFYL